MNPIEQQFRKMLSMNNYFVTKPRLDLFKRLQSSKPLSVSQLCVILASQDQASIYRNVKLFEMLGIIKRIGWGNNSKLELSDLFQHHHHHLTCNKCHKITDLHGEAEIELSIAHVAGRHGFLPLDHQLEIRGICRNCQKS